MVWGGPGELMEKRCGLLVKCENSMCGSDCNIFVSLICKNSQYLIGIIKIGK